MLETVVLVALSLMAEERTVSSLFRGTGQTEVTATGMTVVRAPQTHVLVARIGDDGELSTACAADEATVHALLAEDEKKAQ